MDVIGISFEGPVARIAKLEQRGEKVKITGIKSFIAPFPEDVKQFYNLDSCRFAAGCMNAVLRSLDFPIPSIRKVERGLSFQIESLTSAPPEEIVYASALTRFKKKVQALIFFCRKDALQSTLAQWEQLSLQPDFIGPSAAALVSFAHFRCPELLDAILVHLGSTEWSCVWMQQGKIKKSFTILEGAKQTHLRDVLSSFQETGGRKPILFTGHADSFASLLEGLPAVVLHEPEIPFTPEERLCALSIGAALQCREKKRLQFLAGAFTPRRAFRDAGKKTVAFLLGSLFLSLFIAYFSQLELDGHRQALESQALHETFSVIEKYSAENPYLLQVPTVTEVLSWLSGHPLAHLEDPIQWIDVRYQLNEYPQIGSMKTPYAASVEIEFQVKNPMNARKFHDALLQDNLFVDSTKEVSWESLTDGYRASFQLKNRTPHGF
jgi:hypothetical protein